MASVDGVNIKITVDSEAYQALLFAVRETIEGALGERREEIIRAAVDRSVKAVAEMVAAAAARKPGQ
jgi:hypothetical protein